MNNITTIPTVSPGIGEACKAENECSADCTCQKNVCCPTELTCAAVRTYLGEAGASACGLIEIPGCKPVWCGCAIGSNQYCDEAEDDTGTCVACAIASEEARLTFCSPGSGTDQLAAGRCGKQEVPEGCPEVFCTEGCPTDCPCTPKVCPCSS